MLETYVCDNFYKWRPSREELIMNCLWFYNHALDHFVYKVLSVLTWLLNNF